MFSAHTHVVKKMNTERNRTVLIETKKEEATNTSNCKSFGRKRVNLSRMLTTRNQQKTTATWGTGKSSADLKASTGTKTKAEARQDQEPKQRKLESLRDTHV